MQEPDRRENKLVMAGCWALIYPFLKFRGDIADLELFSQHSGLFRENLPLLYSRNAALRSNSLCFNKNVTKCYRI